MPNAREGGEHERGIITPLVRGGGGGVGGASPEKIFFGKVLLALIYGGYVKSRVFKNIYT